jgi:hypothetical protein
MGRRVLYRMSDIEALEQAELNRVLNTSTQSGE